MCATSVRMWGVRELKIGSCELRAENCELPKNDKNLKKIKIYKNNKNEKIIIKK